MKSDPRHLKRDRDVNELKCFAGGEIMNDRRT